MIYSIYCYEINMLKLSRNIQFMLCECKYGQLKNGPQYGPRKILNRLNKNKDLYFQTASKDLFDIHPLLGYRKIAQNTIDHIQYSNKFPVVLGGDHSISSFTVPYFFDKYKKDMHLVWIDGHADLNTVDSSESMNLHGMSVSHIFQHTNILSYYFPNLYENKTMKHDLFNCDKLERYLFKTKHDLQDVFEYDYSVEYTPSLEQLSYIGISDLDPYETQMLQDHKEITIQTNSDMISKNQDIDLSISDKYVYISFDIDALCQYSLSPSTGTPISSGLNMKHVENVMHYLRENNNKVVGVEIVEYNPLVGNKKQSQLTLNTCHTILDTMLKHSNIHYE